MIEIVPASAADVLQFYGHPMPTMRAIAAKDGQRVLAIASLVTEEARMRAHCDIHPDARADIHQHARSVVRGARAVMRMAAAAGMPVDAIAEDVPGAERLLEHLGFEQITERVWRWRA